MSGDTLNQRGVLLMLDGPDGVGKSTQVLLAADALRERGYKVHTSRLSGGTPIGEALRKISLDPKLKREPQTDLHIILAMYYALASNLRLLLSEGTVCIVDRSPLSIIAYQVYGSKLSLDEGKAATELAFQMFNPDLVICYQAPKQVIEAHRRSRHQKHNNDYFENQPTDFSERVIDGFNEAIKLFSVKTINASKSRLEVHQSTMQLIDEII